MRRRDVCAPELRCSSLASYSALYSTPRRWTPYTSYQGKRMNDVGRNGGRRRGEKVHVSSQLRPSFAKSFVLCSVHLATAYKEQVVSIAGGTAP